MKYVCPKCGAPVSETDNVCPKCGMKFDWGLVQKGANPPDPNVQQQSATQQQTETNQPDQQQASTDRLSKAESKVRGLLAKNQSKNKMFSVIVLGLFLLVSLWPSNDSNSKPQQVKPVPAASSSSSAASAAKAKKDKKAIQTPNVKDEKITGAKNVMIEFGAPNDLQVLATSYGHSDKGFMALWKGEVYIIDLQNKRVVAIGNTKSMLKFRKQVKNHQTGPVIVWFLAPNENHDQDKDKDAGYWDDEQQDLHILPIYMLWKYDGNKVVDAGLYTGNGPQPSHYQGYLYEQKNVDLAHLFMSETIPFLEDAENRGVLGQINRIQSE